MRRKRQYNYFSKFHPPFADDVIPVIWPTSVEWQPRHRSLPGVRRRQWLDITKTLMIDHGGRHSKTLGHITSIFLMKYLVNARKISGGQKLSSCLPPDI